MSEARVLENLLNILKDYCLKHEDNFEAEIYGLIDPNGTIFICSCVLISQSRDPKLILPTSLERIGKFIRNPESIQQFSTEDDGMVLSYGNNDLLELFVYDSNGWSKRTYTICQEHDIYERFIIARVYYNYNLKCPYTQVGIDKCIEEYKTEIENGVCVFKSRNNSILFNSRPNLVTIPEKTGSGSSFTGDDCIGSFFKHKKKQNKNFFDVVIFDLLINKSAGPNTALVAEVCFKKCKVLKTHFEGHTVVYIPKMAPLNEVGELLSNALERQLELIRTVILNDFKNVDKFGHLKSYPIKHFLLGYFLNLVYPSSASEDSLAEYRKSYHSIFLIPTDYPYIRKANLFRFPGERDSRAILNPHDSILKNIVEEEQEGLVKGLYTYHHYMQDNFNDNKWGCAYRSLQTLVSWFRLQGYTDVPIPSHEKIQQTLVDIKDKPQSFVGSKQWIGSTEVGFVLQKLLNISSKYIFVSSGSEIPTRARELIYHFQNVGTPVMIGGGVLAHTIIGCRFNTSTGDVKFLILDPHYTGKDDIDSILKGGWCGWKGPEFWNQTAYYNMCLPLRPTIF